MGICELKIPDRHVAWARFTPGMRLIRVSPRKTKATPTDPLAYFAPPDWHAEADEVHVSVTFTYDKAFAEAQHQHESGDRIQIEASVLYASIDHRQDDHDASNDARDAFTGATGYLPF